MALLPKLQNRAERSQRERGAVLVLTALVMILLLFIAAFATDLGAWYRQGQEQQRAADVGALNGVQAYDRAVKQYFDSLDTATRPVSNWSDLTSSEQARAEALGMAEAVDTVIGLLETSGLNFSNTGSGSLAFDPTDVALDSTWTIVADDGTTVVVTRTFQQTGVDALGAPQYGRAITVDVEAPGEQYFSNILRDAPQIDRSAQSVLSNCGAECTRTIVISPPFAGFNASGDGDGFGPLLFNKDGSTFNGYEEIWAVNHHVSNHSERSSAGDIICMDAQTKEACLGGTTQFDLNTLYEGLQTGNRPVEYFDEERGLLVFAARDADQDESGLACFDARERQFCETDFIDLFPAPTGPVSGYGGWINVTGPFRSGNDFYLFAQTGEWACARLSDSNGGAPYPDAGFSSNTTFTSCGTGDSPAVAGGNMPGIDNTTWYISHGEQVGNKVYMRQPDSGNAQRFYCFDLSTQSACWGTGYREFSSFGYHGDRDLTFFSFDTAGNREGICVAFMHKDNAKHECARLTDGASLGTISGLNDLLKSSSDSWAGDAIAWQALGPNPETRTFFAGGNSNKVGCWDWDTGNCGVLTANSAFTGSPQNWTAPYGFAQVSNECIIGLSHKSVFYSFNPTNLSSCVETNLSTPIFPCECADGGNKWGEIRMPQELMTKTTKLIATISVLENGPAIDPSLDSVDLHLTGGFLDLSMIPSSHNQIYLRLEVDAKLKPNGKPEWEDEIEADLAIVVQPTLTS